MREQREAHPVPGAHLGSTPEHTSNTVPSLDAEPPGDLRVAQPLGHAAHHVELARGEPVERSCSSPLAPEARARRACSAPAACLNPSTSPPEAIVVTASTTSCGSASLAR